MPALYQEEAPWYKTTKGMIGIAVGAIILIGLITLFAGWWHIPSLGGSKESVNETEIALKAVEAYKASLPPATGNPVPDTTNETEIALKAVEAYKASLPPVVNNSNQNIKIGNVEDAARANAWEKVIITPISPRSLANWLDDYQLKTTAFWGNKEFELYGLRSDTRGYMAYNDFSSFVQALVSGATAVGGPIDEYMLPRMQNFVATKNIIVWQEIDRDGTPDEWIIWADDPNSNKDYQHITDTTSYVPKESDGRTYDQVFTGNEQQQTSGQEETTEETAAPGRI